MHFCKIVPQQQRALYSVLSGDYRDCHTKGMFVQWEIKRDEKMAEE